MADDVVEPLHRLRVAGEDSVVEHRLDRDVGGERLAQAVNTAIVTSAIRPVST
jgi:hypothetical protein